MTLSPRPPRSHAPTAPPGPAAAAPAGPQDQIEILVRARYPLLYVATWEEERVLGEISRIAHHLGKKVYDWTIVQGLARHRTAVDGPVEGKKGTRDPVLALREVLNNLADPSIFVFRDFHNFIQDSSVKRTLRDLASTLRSSLSTVVLLSPIVRLPEELEKDVTLVDFPLPGRDELEALLQQIAADVAGNPALRVDLGEASRRALVDAAVGLTINEAENVFARTLVTASRLSLAEAALVYAEKRQVIRKSGLLEYVDVSDTLRNVGGLDQLKSWIGRRRAALEPEAREFGLPPPRGVLLVGVQGCGKSLAAKAISTELGFPLLRLDVGRLFSKMVGETEANVRRALALAEAVAPVVLWVDELEKGLSGVGSSDTTDGGTASRLFATILTWLQEKTSPVFVVATANDIERLPPEVLRKGRFDEIFFVDLPAEEERRTIFAIHLKKRNRVPANFDLDLLARASDGYSGAEIEQAIVDSLFDVYGIKDDVETADVLGAIHRLVPLSRTMRKSVQERRLWSIGRTVSASSATDAAQSVEHQDADDRAKEHLYLSHLAQLRALPPEVARDIQAFLGSFPDKGSDLERMKLYVSSFERLSRMVPGSGQR